MRRPHAIGLPVLAVLIGCGVWQGFPFRDPSLHGADIRDDPRVKQAVQRALHFLDQAEDERLGAKALRARAYLLSDRREHPSVKEALTAIHQAIRVQPSDQATLIYSLGLSISFLTELDPALYRPEIEGLMRMLLSKQKPAGAWGYPNFETCDTSMTQYAVFGLWSAARAGVKVDEQVWIRAANWILRTQDPSGAWGYQGVDPGPGAAAPVGQTETRRSMTEAAMASLYLCGEQLRFYQFESDKLNVSQLLKPSEIPKIAPPPPGVERFRLDDALRRGVQWNESTRQPIYGRFPYYHFYTIERLETFRQAALKMQAGHDQWHLLGVEELLRRQNNDGSWTGPEGPAPGTAFALLFILRATRLSLVKFEGLMAGTVVGGRGLPQTAGGKAKDGPATVARLPSSELSDLVRQMNDPKFLASFQGVENVGPNQEKVEPDKLAKRLLELAGDENPDAKATALLALGRSRNFDDVPVMIEAILDPNPLVHQAAVDALRRFDRRTDEYGKPLPPDEPTRSAEAASWRLWYRTIRPTGR